ncbi:helix-turn-helix domain-containing protein [Halorarius halobius]|uniref:helix-turn-helix domain-containing protein n=1 Tax=Halorarius halobius TaxID=2962671 RepID=UPI0020CE57C5|nr:helix-turn-helix domain-containing protein [Halorarius halobius]
MSKLADLSPDRLREALADAEDAKAAKRLMVALAYKDGVGVDVISERYGIPQSTVYYWLDRLESGSLEEALRDTPKPGRPPKLSDDQRQQVRAWLDESPHERGYDADGWDADLLRDCIDERFGVDYSTPHVRRTFLE